MQLTRFTDLGLRTMMLLAAGEQTNSGSPPAPIATGAGASEHHIAKAVSRLVDLGLVHARRGRVGGLTPHRRRPHGVHRLAGPPTRRRPRGHRLRGDNAVPADAGCRLRRALAEAKEAFYSELDRYTVDDLVGTAPAASPLLPDSHATRKDQLDDQPPPPTHEVRTEPQHAEMVSATLPLVGAHIDEITTEFYRRLFEAHPELLRNLFNRGNQAQGAQQRALAAVVATFAAHLVDPDLPHPADLLSRIGHKHASLGITADQYPIVHEHLFAAIVEVLGADTVTAEVAAAWDRVYWIMADTLIASSATSTPAPECAAGDVYRRARVLTRVDDPPARCW